MTERNPWRAWRALDFLDNAMREIEAALSVPAEYALDRQQAEQLFNDITAARRLVRQVAESFDR
jgi:hypothetical protein